MAEGKVLVLILAGGEGSRMKVLTAVRAKPMLPFAGVYRLIDVPLSHCVHSGLFNVWVIEQFLPHGLNDHLASGRPWDLDRTYGGLRVIQPHTGTAASGWHQGNADAIYRNLAAIRAFDPELILVLSADHIYRLDYRSVLVAHRERKAEVTIVTTEVPLSEAGRFGTVELDAHGQVTTFAYKPEQPRSPLVTTEVFVYNATVLIDTLTALADAQPEEEKKLSDFGHELLPRLVERGHAWAYPLDGYWRDVGTVQSYWQGHMDLLQATPPLRLDDPAWPILTFGPPRLPARIAASAHIDNSLIAAGCEIRGTVRHSVLGPGVIVEAGALVEHSVLFGETVIEPNAQVRTALVDTGVRVGAGAVIGLDAPPDSANPRITLLGQGAQVAADSHIAAGECVAAASREVYAEDRNAATPSSHAEAPASQPRQTPS